MIEGEDALRAVEKNISGARPRELFEDVLEDIEEAYIKNRTHLRDAKLEVRLDMPYEDFGATVSAVADEKVTDIPDEHR